MTKKKKEKKEQWQRRGVPKFFSRVTGLPGKQGFTQAWGGKKRGKESEEERDDTDTAERALFEYLWQVGQSRLQSKMLSVPQPSFSAGLGEDLFHSVTVQNESVLESRLGSIKIQKVQNFKSIFKKGKERKKNKYDPPTQSLGLGTC